MPFIFQWRCATSSLDFSPQLTRHSCLQRAIGLVPVIGTPVPPLEIFVFANPLHHWNFCLHAKEASRGDFFSPFRSNAETRFAFQVLRLEKISTVWSERCVMMGTTNWQSEQSGNRLSVWLVLHRTIKQRNSWTSDSESGFLRKAHSGPASSFQIQAKCFLMFSDGKVPPLCFVSSFKSVVVSTGAIPLFEAEMWYILRKVKGSTRVFRRSIAGMLMFTGWRTSHPQNWGVRVRVCADFASFQCDRKARIWTKNFHVSCSKICVTRETYLFNIDALVSFQKVHLVKAFLAVYPILHGLWESAVLYYQLAYIFGKSRWVQSALVCCLFLQHQRPNSWVSQQMCWQQRLSLSASKLFLQGAHTITTVRRCRPENPHSWRHSQCGITRIFERIIPKQRVNWSTHVFDERSLARCSGRFAVQIPHRPVSWVWMKQISLLQFPGEAVSFVEFSCWKCRPGTDQFPVSGSVLSAVLGLVVQQWSASRFVDCVACAWPSASMNSTSLLTSIKKMDHPCKSFYLEHCHVQEQHWIASMKPWLNPKFAGRKLVGRILRVLWE